MFMLYEDVSGHTVLTLGVAPVIMISNPTAAVLGPVGTLRAPQITFTQPASSLE